MVIEENDRSRIGDETASMPRALNLVNLHFDSVAPVLASRNSQPTTGTADAATGGDTRESRRGSRSSGFANALADNSATGGRSNDAVPTSGYRMPELTIGGSIDRNPAPNTPSLVEDVASRWRETGPWRPDQASIRVIQDRDLPVMQDGLFSPASAADSSRALTNMRRVGIPQAAIDGPIVDRAEAGYSARSAESNFQLNEHVANQLGQAASSNTPEGRRAFYLLDRAASNDMGNVSSEARVSAFQALWSMSHDTTNGGAARFESATRERTDNLVNGLQSNLRDNQTVPQLNLSQAAMLLAAFDRGQSAAIDVVSRIAAGQGGNAATSSMLRVMLGTSHATDPRTRESMADQIMGGVLSSSPVPQNLEMNERLARENPAALQRAIRQSSERAQSDSVDGATRQDATRRLAYVAAGGFGETPAMLQAQTRLTEVARTPEGRRMVEQAIAANEQVGLPQGNVEELRRHIDSATNQTAPEAQGTRTAILNELMPRMTEAQSREVQELTRQAIERHGEPAFRAFLANAQTYQNASPEMRSYLSSDRSLSPNESSQENLLSQFSNPNPAQLDMRSALEQFSRGNLEGPNAFLNNVETRAANLVSAIQNQVTHAETDMRNAQQAYSGAMNALARAAAGESPAAEPGQPGSASRTPVGSAIGPGGRPIPTLGGDAASRPRVPESQPSPALTLEGEPSEVSQINVARNANRYFAEASANRRERQQELDAALGTQLLGTHARLRQQSQGAADSLAIMAANYIDRSALPAFLQNQVRTADGQVGPALHRAGNAGTNVERLPNSNNEAISILNRTPLTSETGRASLTQQNARGRDVLQAVASGALPVDREQLQAESRAAQMYGAARRITSGTDELANSQRSFNDHLAALHQLDGQAYNVSGMSMDQQRFIVDQFSELRRMIGPETAHARGFDNTTTGGTTQRQDQAANNASFESRRAEVARASTEVNAALARLPESQRNTEAGRELELRARGLQTLNDLLDPTSRLNHQVRDFIDGFSNDVTAGRQSRRLQEGAQILFSIALAMTASPVAFAELGAAGRMAAAILNNSQVRSALTTEAQGMLNLMTGQGDAGPLTRVALGRTDWQSGALEVAGSAIQRTVSGTVGRAVVPNLPPLSENATITAAQDYVTGRVRGTVSHHVSSALGTVPTLVNFPSTNHQPGRQQDPPVR